MYSGIPQAPWDGVFVADILLNAFTFYLVRIRFTYLSVHPIHV